LVCLIFAITGANGLGSGNMGKRECCSGFSERVCQFITGKSSGTEDPLEALSYTGERVGEVPNIPGGLELKKHRGPEKESEGRLGVS